MSDPIYLTRDLPGIGGMIKQRPEDFVVDEVPLYAASGTGTHLYFKVRKRGIPTPAAVQRIARHMGANPEDIGYAGLKDAQAITTQWMSLEHVPEERLRAFSDAQIEILEVTRHGNKLKTGHLAGNRFQVKVRGAGGAQDENGVPGGQSQWSMVPSTPLGAGCGRWSRVPESTAADSQIEADSAPGRARAILDVLCRRGVPNYFGVQRFGARSDGSELGQALVAGDDELFLSLYVGRAREDDPPDCRAARAAFDAGEPARAMELWPRHYGSERRTLAAYLRKRNPHHAVAAMDKRMKRLFVSAFQSRMFNEILAARIDTLDQVLPGDLAQKTDTGGIFFVEDLAADQPRAEAFAISPTGPLFGHKVRLAQGEPGRIEQEVADRYGITPEGLRRVDQLKIPGTRRALRFPLQDVTLESGTDDAGPYLGLCFTLPSGCYATVVLGEVMKTAL